MSIIRPLLRPLPARILIGLLAGAVGGAALLPAVAGAGPKSKGSHLVFRLSGQTRQDVVGAKAIALIAHCPAEACKVTVSATSKSPAIRTAEIHARVRAGGSERIAIPLSAGQRGKLKAALKAGHGPTLTVRAVAHDGAGDKVPLTLMVRATKS